MLPPPFKRRLLGDLCCCAVRALLFYFQAAAGKTLEPGIVAFITDDQVVDRIVDHLKLTFVAEKPPSRVSTEVALMVAEQRMEYFL
jgi:hypothetical protein